MRIYSRGGLPLERFLPLGVEGADILILFFQHEQQTHVWKSAGNISGDQNARREFWMLTGCWQENILDHYHGTITTTEQSLPDKDNKTTLNFKILLIV